MTESTTSEPTNKKLISDLRVALSECDGDAKDPTVVKIVEELSKVSPFKKNATKEKEFLGTFEMISKPSFPGRIKSSKSSTPQYTLGHLSFGVFQPKNLKCSLHSVRNIVESTTIEEKEDIDTYTYTIILDLTIHTEEQGDLKAVMINDGYCFQDPTNEERTTVTFTGTTLRPNDEMLKDDENLKKWSKTFENAYQKATQELSYFSWAMKLLFSYLLGMSMPTDNEKADEYSFHFKMKRFQTGYLDNIYLDDELRITRGNRGTVVIVEQLKELSKDDFKATIG